MEATHPLDIIKDPIKKELFSIGLKKVFGQSYFSICCIQETVSVINPAGESILSELRPLHCQPWSSISRGMAEHIIELTAKAMVFSPIFLSVGDIDQDVEEARAIIKDILYPPRVRYISEKPSNLFPIEVDTSGTSKPARKAGVVARLFGNKE